MKEISKVFITMLKYRYEISGSIKHRDLVSVKSRLFIRILIIQISPEHLKTIALSDDLTAVLFQEVTHNSDTG